MEVGTITDSVPKCAATAGGRGVWLAVAVLTACLGACTSSEPEAQGHAGSGGSAGSDGSAGSGGSMTEAQWAALTAPLTQPHSVLPLECDGEAIAQDYQVVPTVSCAVSPSYSVTNPVRYCSVEPACTGPEDCQEEPFGSCRGAAEARCTYDVGQDELCTEDADCTSLPGGSCPVNPLDDILCYPTGECKTPSRACYYLEQICSDDSDCTASSGGRCNKLIRFTRCRYDLCASDSDCTTGERCTCADLSQRRVCVPADCSSDEACGDGATCRLELGCYDTAARYHCSSEADTCQTNADCSGLYCSASEGPWQCVDLGCPLID